MEESFCPNCGERVKPLPVLYGYPTPETWEKEQRGELVIGGCDPTFGADAVCPLCRAPIEEGGQVERLELGTEERWLLDLHANPEGPYVHRVRELLPDGFEHYLRVLHPFLRWDLPEGTEVPPAGFGTWRSLADEAGVEFTPEIREQSLRPVLPLRERGGRPYGLSEGQLEEPARSRLFGLLAETAVRPDVYFYYGLAAIVMGKGALLFRATMGDLDSVQRAADAASEALKYSIFGPEYIWPADRSWVVMTDYDLTSTYVACGWELAERLLADAVLEVVPVSLMTRVDGRTDIAG